MSLYCLIIALRFKVRNFFILQCFFSFVYYTRHGGQVIYIGTNHGLFGDYLPQYRMKKTICIYVTTYLHHNHPHSQQKSIVTSGGGSDRVLNLDWCNIC